MSDRTDALAQALFDKPSLQECSLQQVDYLAHQYPFFCTAQLVLLQKTAPDEDVYQAQLQRAALQFANPLQLQYWLQPDAFETELPSPQLFQNPIQDTQPEATAEIMETTAAEEVAPVAAAVVQPDKPEETQQSEPGAETITLQPVETPATPALTFEPYHTVDYFASQGIKLSQQEATNDQLGKQLKSFTEWLKTMKRLPETTAQQKKGTTGERNVENLAAHSLDAADVVTESMAEVWQKQGAIEKAADVYRKLSLHNPSKSAYFAAKIESLKRT